MKFKKAMAVLLTAVMSVSVLSGCGSTDNQAASGTNEGTSKEAAESSTKEESSQAESKEETGSGETPVITFMAADHYGRALANEGSDDVLQAAMDYTGINVEFNWVANDSYNDVLGITLMDKSNMPMVITYGSDLQANIVQAAKDGAFWDLGEFVWDAEKYPNLSQMSEDVCNAFTVDGQLVGIYRSRPIGRNGLGYRTDWAEKLGLETPKTVEDVYNMMYEFTYSDPDGNGKNDTYGLCLCKYTGPLDIIQAWFGAGNQWKEVDGELIPIHQTEEYMEALRWMRKMYEDGLVYQDWATRETNTWSDGVKNGECGMFLDVLDNSRRIWDYFVSEEIEAVTGEGLAGMTLVGAIAAKDGEEPRTLATSGSAGCYLITKAGAKTVEDVEACLQYLDKMNDMEMRILADYGLEGRDHEIKDGLVVDLLKDKEVQEKPQIGMNQSVPFVPEELVPLDRTERQLIEEDVKADNIQYAVFNPASGYLVSSSVNAEMGTDLKDILDRARTQFICGQLDEAGLMAQFDVWAQRGGNDLIAEINEMHKAN
ncbi:extracellular solute-binding protein [Lachnospiraceae bacterium OttesenSCG-928-D06]|nr:extracellular solute-binding protein [Lachnospiraceae bacterium OttesenSCG-928-D06]